MELTSPELDVALLYHVPVSTLIAHLLVSASSINSQAEFHMGHMPSHSFAEDIKKSILVAQKFLFDEGDELE